MGPSLTFGDRYALLDGRVPYRELARGVPSWLCPELCATPHARARLLTWVQAGGLARPAPDVSALLQFCGDHHMRSAVCAALSSMAPPARDFVIERTLFLGVGWSTSGWISAFPAGSWSRVVLLSGARRDCVVVERTALHEAAHSWLESYNDPEPFVLDPRKAVEELVVVNRRCEFRCEELVKRWWRAL